VTQFIAILISIAIIGTSFTKFLHFFSYFLFFI
jgi:hypothetical protein